jgi:predicted GNAT family acetyltransferase
VEELRAAAAVAGAGAKAEVERVEEFAGRFPGWAAALIRRVMAGFAERGDIAFLHSYAENAGAIRLYESLGFRIRRPMTATVWGRAAS